jgi:phosphoribosylaminoimidazole-succinocarboxamide synthase
MTAAAKVSTDVSVEDERALASVLTDAHFPELPNFQRGKVRDSYDLDDGRRVMIATDRQSAFDKVLAAVPFKGQVLTQTARYWFDESVDICPNHVIGYPHPNVILSKRLDMLPVEMVVRDYLTGSTETSIWPMYERGERLLYGHTFQDGLVKNQKLPETIITPTTKGTRGEHDRPITAAEIVAEGLLTQALWDELAEKSLAVFARGRELAAKQGLILVDTKFEFGLDEAGRVVLADEILTPDSSRYWLAATYPEALAGGAAPNSLDKEFLRLWINARCDPYNDPIPEIPADTLIEFSGKYIALFETVTGKPFEKPDVERPLRDQIRDALAREFPDFF